MSLLLALESSQTFTYNGVIACQATVAAALAKIRVPGVIYSGQTTVSAAVVFAKVPPAAIDGISTIAAGISKTNAPLVEIGASASLSSAYSFVPAVVQPPISSGGMGWVPLTRREPARVFVSRPNIRARTAIESGVSRTVAPETTINGRARLASRSGFWQIERLRRDEEEILELMDLGI